MAIQAESYDELYGLPTLEPEPFESTQQASRKRSQQDDAYDKEQHWAGQGSER